MLNLAGSSHDADEEWAVLQDDAAQSELEFSKLPVVSIRIADLDLDGSPRLGGEDPEHTRALADVHGVLPPITVHHPTLRVIDGRHRIRAALLNGREVITARLVECDEATAYVLAVKENVTHGLPLSVADRKVAALNIIASHPDWSDRSVAEATGLSDKTVSGLRNSSTAETPQSNVRRGKDGRLRPVNSAAMRRQAAAMMSERPEAGLREIARATRLSPATVRDVRQRIERGEDPVPARYRDEPATKFPATLRPPRRPSGSLTPEDRRALLAKLLNDPSLKFSQAGRHVLRWLHHYSLDSESCQSLAESIPDHWSTIIAELARNCAAAWNVLAEQLERRRAEPSRALTDDAKTASQ